MVSVGHGELAVSFRRRRRRRGEQAGRDGLKRSLTIRWIALVSQNEKASKNEMDEEFIRRVVRNP
jgi:hypothetical protein